MVHRKIFFTIPFIALGIASLIVIHQVKAQTGTGVDVQLIPIQGVVTPDGEIAIEMWVNPNGHSFTASEIHLNFDPAVIAPASPHPLVPGSEVSLILPNCSAGTECPATSSASTNEALMYVGVNCTETEGCPIPPNNTRFLLATFYGRMIGSEPKVATLNPRHNSTPTLTAAIEFDTDATRNATATTVSLSPCGLPFDYTPDGTINVVDIMKTASVWNSNSGSTAYNGQFDSNRDGQIDIVDIQQTAAKWNSTCTN